jgi:hypothetical protein
MLLLFGIPHPMLHDRGLLPLALAAATSVVAVLPVSRAMASVFEDRVRMGAAFDRVAGSLRRP